MNEKEIFVVADHSALLPVYATPGSSGADVYAHLTASVIIKPGESAMIPTGLKMLIPEGYEIQVRPRSGLAWKHQITVLNTPGTIDSDYRGEIAIILINHGKETFIITPLMRIAQLVLSPVIRANFSLQEDIEVLTQTARGVGGFGHTGLKTIPAYTESDAKGEI